jgi:ATP-dependent RNA helicase DeaD
MPDPIRRLAARYLRDPETIELGRPRGISAPTIEQRYYEVPGRYKLEALVRLLDVEQPQLAIVFCGTKRMVDEVSEALRARGYRAEAIHGDMGQPQRDRAIRALRSGQAELLVATDVAARGLDIEQVSHVINYDLPQDPEYYIHRIGRTGRYGRAGQALTLVTPWELQELRLIERIIGARITRAEIPTAAEVAERERDLLAERIVDMLRSGNWGQYRSIVEVLAADHDPVDIGAAAIALAEQHRPRPARKRGEGSSESSDLEKWLRTPRREKPARRPGPPQMRRRPREQRRGRR